MVPITIFGSSFKQDTSDNILIGNLLRYKYKNL